MIETDPPASPMADCAPQDRVARLEAMLDAVLGRLSAQATAIDLLLKALTAIDRASGVAVAMALEVAELDLLEAEGETEAVRALRHIREQMEHALPPEHATAGPPRGSADQRF
jgi:hypothetical protein